MYLSSLTIATDEFFEKSRRNRFCGYVLKGIAFSPSSETAGNGEDILISQAGFREGSYNVHLNPFHRNTNNVGFKWGFYGLCWHVPGLTGTKSITLVHNIILKSYPVKSSSQPSLCTVHTHMTRTNVIMEKGQYFGTPYLRQYQLMGRGSTLCFIPLTVQNTLNDFQSIPRGPVMLNCKTHVGNVISLGFTITLFPP